MNLLALSYIAGAEINKTGIPGWKFNLSTLPVNAGECDLKNKTISLNSEWSHKNNSRKCLKVLAEEIEHMIVCGVCEKRFTCGEDFHCEKLKKNNQGGIR